jgi:hypothetical protein
MWAPIFDQNKTNVSKALGDYIERLKTFKDAIDSHDLDTVGKRVDRSVGGVGIPPLRSPTRASRAAKRIEALRCPIFEAAIPEKDGYQETRAGERSARESINVNLQALHSNDNATRLGVEGEV